MEFLQLRYFFESAHSQSFAKTAEKYMVPTTSVSASVKRLENELGCSLFDRYANKIKLNHNGERLLNSLETVFDELNRAVVDISGNTADTREIKMLVRAMREDITDYIIEFRKNNPNIAFKIILDFKETNYDDFDIIIDEKGNIGFDWEEFELLKLKLRLMTHKNSNLLNKKLCMKDLKQESFVSWGEKSNMQNILTKACQSAGYKPNIAVMSNDTKCHQRFIESGLGIGLAREEAQNTEEICALDICDFNEIYTVCTYYKKGSAYGNVQKFLEFLKSKA